MRNPRRRLAVWELGGALSILLTCAAAPPDDGAVRSPAATAPASESDFDPRVPPAPARVGGNPALDTSGEEWMNAQRPPAAPTPAEREERAATPIDLPSALRLAGVQNLQLVLAQQRVESAVAAQQFAAAQLLPTLNLGVDYDKHTGVLQQASGNILSVDRNSLYAGAGGMAVGAGAVQIPGLQYNVNISPAIFDYLSSRQVTSAARFDRRAADNAIGLSVAIAYSELLRTTAGVRLAILERNDAAEIARLTAVQARTGQGRPADADRAATELDRREQAIDQARSRAARASDRLVDLLNLDPMLQLAPADTQVVPQAVVPPRIPLPELIAIALVERPELQSRRATIRAALLQLDSARVLPFSPTFIGGLSEGVFGGGSNVAAASGGQFFGDISGRFDLDVVLYWSLRNLGVGNCALIKAARARVRESQLDEMVMLDQVRDEVAAAYVRAHTRFAQIGREVQAVRAGSSAIQEDLLRVRNLQGLPIELLYSFRELAGSRLDYLGAIIGFNQAEFELYVALGSPPADTLARAVPDELWHPPMATLQQSH